MAIITKPSILKGIAAQFSLDKSELSAISLVSNDSYFSDMSNWYRVNVIYKSSPGSQYEIVEFDATQESPVGHFLVSEKARDIFEVIKVKILDFDGGFLEIPRSSLTTADFDISFEATEPVVNALLSTENDGDFEFSPDLNLNTSYVLSPGLELRGGFYTYRYVITTFLDASKAAEAGLVQGNSYKLRVYFNSFSTQVPDTITMTFRSGYNGSMPSITGAELLSSIQQLGYVDIPFDFFPFGDYLWIYENVPVEQSSEGATTFEISKIEVIE